MIVRNAISLPPALHGGVIAMAESARQRADAPSVGDDAAVGHVRYVRPQRTLVNDVDCVRAFDVNERMAQTTGEALIELKARAKLSLDAIAKAGGYAGRSSVQLFFTPSYDKPLDTEVAAKLAKAFEGRGDPEIKRTELFLLTGLPEREAIVQYEGASLERMRQDVPILGTALGADRVVDDLAVEQTYLYTQEVIGYAKRPVILDGRADVYGIYVQGSSMAPALKDGALAFAEKNRPPQIGDNVVVWLRMTGVDHEADDGHSARTILVKELVRRSGSYIELKQYSPEMTFRLDAKDVMHMHRVMTMADLVS